MRAISQEQQYIHPAPEQTYKQTQRDTHREQSKSNFRDLSTTNNNVQILCEFINEIYN